MTDDQILTLRDSGHGVTSPAVLLVFGADWLSSHEFIQDRVVIGRSPDCEISLPHRSLSRRHAEVRLGPPLSVQDLGSTNGTRVRRGTRFGGDAIEIGPGETFYIGPFAFMVLTNHEANATPSARRDWVRVEDPTVGGIPEVVRKIAASAASILILGETGVGKEVLARTIHELSRRAGPCVRIHCAALAESLLESELFGHEKGAFTGATSQKRGLLESAHGGTAFLDEIGELSPTLQVKLLRVLEAKEVTRVGAVDPVSIDVRFIAATHRDLAKEVTEGRFRADLFYRLDGVSLCVPPLRERRAMIADLTRNFIAAATSRPVAIPPAFVARLEQHDWPGNVRELKATVERALLVSDGTTLTTSHLMFSKRIPNATIPPPKTGTPLDSKPQPGWHDLSSTQVAERERIVATLESCAGNQTRAAKQLGISRATLTTKLSLYRIPRPRR